MLNHERSLHGLSALRLAVRQSTGIAPCVGSIGHSRAMAGTHSIWHMRAGYPLASFPRNICVPYVVAGENVGEATSGNELHDLQLLLQAMMDEPHSPRFCLSSDNHACNILRSTYHRVGIGLYYVNSTTWLTEDFTG